MASSNQGIRLPRRLPRPRPRAIDERVIAAIDPQLENVPFPYIQEILETVGPRLLRAASRAALTPLGRTLPRQHDVIYYDLPVEVPTHIIVVWRRNDTRVSLFPVHAMVLVTNCSRLPAFPRSTPNPQFAPGGSIRLPLVPLRIPSPPTFPILLSYLYTKRESELLVELLPAIGPSMDQTIRDHARSLSVNGLMALVRKVHGVWANMFVLGISDDRLSRALEMAWDIILAALVIRSRSAGVRFYVDNTNELY